MSWCSLTVWILRLDGIPGPGRQGESLLVDGVHLELVEVARAQARDLRAQAVGGGLGVGGEEEGNKPSLESMTTCGKVRCVFVVCSRLRR